MKKALIFFLFVSVASNAQFIEMKSDRIQFNPKIYMFSPNTDLPIVKFRSVVGEQFTALTFENESGVGFFDLVGLENESRFNIYNKLNIQVYNNNTGTPINRLSILNNGKVGISTNNPQTDFEVNGFTKLGSDAPAIKVKKLIGITAATQNGQVLISHGLDESKILSVGVMVDYGTNDYVHPAYLGIGGFQFEWYLNGTNIYIWNRENNSSNILSKPVKILITYEE